MQAVGLPHPLRSPVGTGKRSPHDGPLLVLLGGIALVAFVVRLRLLTHGAGIAASDGYDDGVYYVAADAFVHGRLPYRDFLLLHPPGIVLALSPFAAIGSLLGDPVGVTTGRLVFIGIGAVNSALVGVLASRHSRAASVVGAGAAAVWYPLAYAERSTLLEPLGTLLLLLAVLAAWRLTARRGALIAGLLAGCSVDVKIWYVVPAVLIGLLVVRWRVFLSSAVAGAAMVALPFLAADPVAMVREVLLDQLGRPRTGGGGATVHRIVTIAADPRFGGAQGAQVVAVLVLVLVAIGALGSWSLRWARPFVVLTAATSAVLLAGPSFFPHYVAFVAPWMLLTLAIGIGVLVARLRARPARAAAALLVVAALGALDAPAIRAEHSSPQPVAALRRVLAPRAGCVISDDPGLLANADVLSRDLVRGCPLWPDVTGWTYDRDLARRGDVVVPRVADPLWQRDVAAYLLSGDTVVLARRDTGLSAATRDRIADLPLVARAGRLEVRRTW